MCRLTRTCLAIGVIIACASGPAAGQSLRVAEDARQIRAFRLSDDHLPKLREVGRILARGFKPTPEQPRADGAVFVVLAMSLACNQPFSDRTVTDTVQTIESGHADLHTAIGSARLTTSEYVLAQITLILAAPVVAGERAGRTRTVADVAVDNVAFVRRHWAEVESIMTELSVAGGRPQP